MQLLKGATNEFEGEAGKCPGCSGGFSAYVQLNPEHVIKWEKYRYHMLYYVGIVEYDYYQFLKGKYFHRPVVLVPMS